MTNSPKSDRVLSNQWFRLWGLALLVVAVSACELKDSESTSPSTSGEVVFSAAVGGNTDIFKTDSESESSVRLTTASSRDYLPAWSPDRKMIAYLSDRDDTPTLWVMDVVGGSKRQISEAGLPVEGFRWSPNSKQIGVEFVENGSHRIEIINVESGKSDLLTPRSENAKIGDWSPDGQWVVYAVGEGEDGGIRRRNPAGVDEISVTTGEDTNPRWSPNGKWIAFNRVADDGSIDLFVTDIDGEETTNLAPDAFDETSFDWSPDSKHIVYENESSGNPEIYVATPDGKDTSQLTSNRVIDKAPRWSPKGSLILFQSEGDGSFDLYTMNIEGDHQVRKTTFHGRILEADW